MKLLGFLAIVLILWSLFVYGQYEEDDYYYYDDKRAAATTETVADYDLIPVGSTSELSVSDELFDEPVDPRNQAIPTAWSTAAATNEERHVQLKYEQTETEDYFEAFDEKKCSRQGEVFQAPPIAYAEAAIRRKRGEARQTCYMFIYCKKQEAEGLRPIKITCPPGLQWKEGTVDCELATPECTKYRQFASQTPVWLDRKLACPPTASLSSNELSNFHRLEYFLMMNKSETKQRDRQGDHLTPIILQLGVYRHELESCEGYFQCQYEEHTPFVHVLKRAQLKWCPEPNEQGDIQVYNMEWNKCVAKSDYPGRYEYTHPNAEMKQMCEYYT